ncbi:5-demethoxyubiquinol-8 5-hydroxylase UbiM [Stenotrophomonas mori]|uniref:5-demethoxyubiquinol-8 5-hydroxylase UbiM n=1 Tax=Stenotrophomonas mori TaxID=2871096 RepID=A0ABT0SG80_9GAMM|nr:5-demethoxyubiquinol-8 5-hydroxylase UbiM [Stenotrophomonas mori]MCL7714330.1 5-demethoxyubiquinol-8 5-hydroxylase UbiM [Stenotrophomonas mori]
MRVFDVLVVGAGPVGLCLARGLADTGLAVALVELQPAAALAGPAFDGREIALTHASRQILQAQGLWARIDPAQVSPLRSARVMNGASPFALGFSAGAENVEELGWLVPNHLIRRAAWEAVQGQSGLALFDGARVTAIEGGGASNTVVLDDGRRLSARLVVAADSRFSATRRMMGIGAQMRDFGKSMLVCRMRHERPHHHAAWEWFGYGRTQAMLPLPGDHCSAVITLPPQGIQALMAMDDADFGEAVTGFFEQRLGRMQPVGSRHVYPLVGVYAHRFAGPRYALAGDAAVGMHPVTAHGFNFGLQSQQRLVKEIATAAARGGDIGAAGVLARYERGHRLATRPLYEATNAVATLYNDNRLPARVLRNAALRVAHGVTPFRKMIAAHLTQRPAT